jgi:hypothetical protein
MGLLPVPFAMTKTFELLPGTGTITPEFLALALPPNVVPVGLIATGPPAPFHTLMPSVYSNSLPVMGSLYEATPSN